MSREEEETHAVMLLIGHFLAGWRSVLILRDTFKCLIAPKVPQNHTLALGRVDTSSIEGLFARVPGKMLFLKA